jgi:hypothetical protein
LVLVYSTVAGNQANQAFDNIDALALESFGSVVAGGPVNCDPGVETTSHGYNFSDDNSRIRLAIASPAERPGVPVAPVGVFLDSSPALALEPCIGVCTTPHDGYSAWAY